MAKRHMHITIDNDVYWFVKANINNSSELINNFLQNLSEINDKNGFDDDFDEEKLNSERMVLQEEIRKLKNELQDKERRHVEIFSLLESNSERIKRDIRRKIEVQQAIRATGYQQ